MHLFPEHGLFHLNDACIDVWSVSVEPSSNVIPELETVLSAAERERAARFIFDRDRNVWIAARGALRMLLGLYLDVHPASIDFVYSEKGKPSLPNSNINFNVSHTRGVILLAFTEGCELGVDIELIRPLPDMMQIANLNFCRDEAQELAGLSEEARQPAFFRCWTRKESYVKATGNGLSTPLGEFRVSFREGESVRFLQIGKDPLTASQWALHDLDISPAYAAAIAYRDVPRQIKQSPLLRPEEFIQALKLGESTNSALRNKAQETN